MAAVRLMKLASEASESTTMLSSLQSINCAPPAAATVVRLITASILACDAIHPRLDTTQPPQARRCLCDVGLLTEETRDWNRGERFKVHRLLVEVLGVDCRPSAAEYHHRHEHHNKPPHGAERRFPCLSPDLKRIPTAADCRARCAWRSKRLGHLRTRHERWWIDVKSPDILAWAVIEVASKSVGIEL